jgi:DNA-binding transcriptional LysR family regulator
MWTARRSGVFNYASADATRIPSGALDMAVSMEYPAGEQIASRELLREELSVMVGPSHPAANLACRTMSIARTCW